MSQATYKSKPLPVDPGAEAQEAERRESLNVNAPYQRGVVHAESLEKSNRRGELAQNLADLKRVTLKRDTTQPARDAYDRKWRAVYAMAERFATAFGETVSMPAYLPPPQATAESTVAIEPGKPADGSYRETKGMGPSGKGGPLPGFPGSDADAAWLSVQGAKP